jgi:RimJ/RimL family protein N-acetyltransferase
MSVTQIAPLRTTRLLLRPVVEADAQATAALVTPDVAANLSTWPSPMSAEQALERIRQAQDKLARRQGVDFAIVDAAEGSLLGWIGLACTDAGRARLGYWLGTAYRNRGIAKEAAAAALPASAAFLGVALVEAHVLTGNAPSIAVLESVGFTYAGEQRLMLESAGIEAACLHYVHHGPWTGLPDGRAVE